MLIKWCLMIQLVEVPLSEPCFQLALIKVSFEKLKEKFFVFHSPNFISCHGLLGYISVKPHRNKTPVWWRLKTPPVSRSGSQILLVWSICSLVNVSGNPSRPVRDVKPPHNIIPDISQPVRHRREPRDPLQAMNISQKHASNYWIIY